MMVAQLPLPQFDALFPPRQQCLPLVVPPTGYDSGTRGLSWRRLMLRAFATRAIEAGYLWQDARTQALIPHLLKMQYDDALVCGQWRLELLYLSSGMPHFRLYWRGRVFGVADIYADHADIGSSRKTPVVRQMLAAYLVFYGWTAQGPLLHAESARTPLDADVSRQYRLFKITMAKKRPQRYDMLKEMA